MSLSAMSGHVAGGLVSQCGSNISRHECTLSQVDTRPNMTLDVART